MDNKELPAVQVSEALPFLRYGAESGGPDIVSADSDSASCSSDSESGSGAGECAHVPKQPEPQP